MKKFVLAIAASLIIISCGSVDPISVVEGTYNGTYSITKNYGTDSAYTLQIGIDFEFYGGNQYVYVTDKSSLLPIGFGRFNIHKTKMFLSDNTRGNANFDATLLLDGTFNFSFGGKKMILIQHNKKYGRYIKLELNKLKEGTHVNMS
jgi:hypothetical protein